MKAAIVLTFFASVGLAVSEPCPEPSTILPCSCHGESYQIVTCSNVTDFGSIKKVLTGKFPGDFDLDLTNIKEKTFERGAAHAISVYTVSIADSPMIESFANDSLMDMAQLKWLEISDTSLTTIPTAALSMLSKLFSFKCEHSKITRLLKKDFDGITKELVNLVLNRNPISSIEEGVFTGLPNLFAIEIRRCRLKTLPAGQWFHSDSKIVLYLSYDEFTTIPMEAFSRLKDSDIVFSKNKIRQLPTEAEMAKFINKGNWLGLEGNPLECACDMKWILKYELPHSLNPQLRGSCAGEGLRQSKDLQKLTAADFSDCNSTSL